MTDTDPYADFKPKIAQKQMTEDEINKIKDLEQIDKTMDLNVDLFDFTISLRERPYLSD